MATPSELQEFAEKGKRSFEWGEYEDAIQSFESAAQGYTSLDDQTNAAEMKNNLSVALLKFGKSQEALDAVLGTEDVFARAHDGKRQGMAVGNQAAALDALGRLDEALDAYQRSADIFAEAGEGDLRSMVLKSAAGIKFRHGKFGEAAFKMIGSLEAKEKPSIFERLLRSILRLVQK